MNVGYGEATMCRQAEDGFTCSENGCKVAGTMECGVREGWRGEPHVQEQVTVLPFTFIQT